MTIKLNLPEYEFKLRNSSKGTVIFDSLRRKYVALTPEEWVRQNFVAMLINERGFPATLMNNEVALLQNGIKRRCDTIVSGRDGNPLVIVEYKAPSIAITQKVFDQIVRYNMVLRAKYLIVSNGLQHYCCMIDYSNNSYIFIEDIPSYSELEG